LLWLQTQIRLVAWWGYSHCLFYWNPVTFGQRFPPSQSSCLDPQVPTFPSQPCAWGGGLTSQSTSAGDLWGPARFGNQARLYWKLWDAWVGLLKLGSGYGVMEKQFGLWILISYKDVTRSQVAHTHNPSTREAEDFQDCLSYVVSVCLKSQTKTKVIDWEPSNSSCVEQESCPYSGCTKKNTKSRGLPRKSHLLRTWGHGGQVA
jgi:hypothetical protein